MLAKDAKILTEHIFSAVRVGLKSGALAVDNRAYVIIVPTNFSYGKRFIASSAVSEYRTEQHPRDESLKDFAYGLSRSVREIMQLHSLSDKFAIVSNETYLAQLVHRIVRHGISREHCGLTLTAAVNDERPFARIEIWIDGIYLEDGVLRINDDYVIRRFGLLDAEYDPRARGIRSGSILSSYPSAVIDGFKRLGHPDEISFEIEKFLRLMSLLGVAAPRELARRVNTASVDMLSQVVSHKIDDWRSDEAFLITKEIIEKYHRLDYLIDPYLIRHENELSYIHGDIWTSFTDFDIAFHHYRKALTEKGLEERLTHFAQTFEALLGESDSHTEITRRISQRTSLLLGYIGENPESVYDSLKRAYGYRSIYAHGSRIAQNKKSYASRTAVSLKEIARKTLLAVVLMRTKYSHANLINILDKAMINIHFSIKLKREVRQFLDIVS